MGRLLVICLFAIAFTAAKVVEVKQEVEQNVHISGILDESIYVDVEEDLDEKEDPEPDALNANKYYLYTRRNPSKPQTLIYNEDDSVLNSNFAANQSTVVVVHGWLSSQHTDINPVIRDAYLEKFDVNVIILDWGRIAIGEYAFATSMVPSVGRHLGEFMAFLNRVTGASYDNVHLIGFSLGAHVVGNAGRELGGKVACITGLDPAGPLWTTNKKRLNPKDAVYVEAIHTNCGRVPHYGIGFAVGHTDFFPNGGTSQPGCIENICNHNRAWQLFAATVTHHNLQGLKCKDLEQAKEPENACTGTKLLMGTEQLSKPGKGLYGLNTGAKYPYTPK